MDSIDAMKSRWLTVFRRRTEPGQQGGGGSNLFQTKRKSLLRAYPYIGVGHGRQLHEYFKEPRTALESIPEITELRWHASPPQDLLPLESIFMSFGSVHFILGLQGGQKAGRWYLHRACGCGAVLRARDEENVHCEGADRHPGGAWDGSSLGEPVNLWGEWNAYGAEISSFLTTHLEKVMDPLRALLVVQQLMDIIVQFQVLEISWTAYLSKESLW